METKLDIIHRCFEEGEEIKHQDSPHSALNGRPPREVFDSDAAFTPLVHVSKEDLDKAFLQTCKRKVSKDGTVSLHGRKYEVGNLLLRGFRMLDACMTEYGKRHPDADLCVTAVEECEEVRHTELLPIDFSRLNSSKEAGHV